MNKKKVAIIITIVAIILVTSVFIAFILIGIIPLPLTYTQETVGTEINPSTNGAWWGAHATKVVRSSDTTSTYVLTGTNTPYTLTLYSKTDGGDWTKGVSIAQVSRSPCILRNSTGHIHIVGHRSFTTSNDNEGQLFHLRFINPNTISGANEFEFISPDWRGNPVIENYTSYYCGAAIGADDTIMVAYQSTNLLTNTTYCMGARIYNATSGNWNYETITTSLPARYCYPFVYVTASYFHVLAVEDEYDEAVGDPDHNFRFGEIRHFQRARGSTTWTQTTLININTDLTPAEVNQKNLRNSDLYVDSSGIVHVLIKQNTGLFDGSQIYHYWKTESETTWSSELISPININWAKLWERSDGTLFYVCSDHQITLMPKGGLLRYGISNLASPYSNDPVHFIATKRSGSVISTSLDVVVYAALDDTEAMHISVDVSSI